MSGRANAELAARHLDRCARGGGRTRRRCERELVLLYQDDPSTHGTVVAAFRPLAIGVAKRYRRGEEPLDDLVQVALVGLVKALRRFDADRGAPFVTYALPTMMGEVRRHFRDTGWAVHVTRGAQELAQKVVAIDRQEGGRLSAEEVAERIGASAEDVVEGRMAAQAMRADSLDHPRDAGEDSARPAFVATVEERGYAAAEDRATLARLTRGLPEREREILALRYSGDLSQAEIGRRVGLSQMHVSRILRRTLAELHPEA